MVFKKINVKECYRKRRRDKENLPFAGSLPRWLQGSPDPSSRAAAARKAPSSACPGALAGSRNRGGVTGIGTMPTCDASFIGRGFTHHATMPVSPPPNTFTTQTKDEFEWFLFSWHEGYQEKQGCFCLERSLTLFLPLKTCCFIVCLGARNRNYF